MGKKILITGGCGYIGSALFRYLESRGHACFSVDMLRRGNPGKIPNRQMDFCWVRPVDFGVFDVIVHLAAMATVAECERDPVRAFYDNLVYPVNVVERLQGETLIYASTGSLHSDNGVSTVYDFTKGALERAMKLFYPQAVGLRFGTVCGPSPNIRGTMINAMVESAAKRGFVQASNLDVRRPILGITDLCRAVEAQIDCPLPGVHDLCSFNTIVRDVAEKVASSFHCPVEASETGSATYDFQMRCAEWFDPRESISSIISDLRASVAAVKESVG